MARGPAPATGTTAVFGSHVLTLADGAQAVLSDHWVVVEGDRVARPHPSASSIRSRAISKPEVCDKPGWRGHNRHQVLKPHDPRSQAGHGAPDLITMR